MIHYPRTVRVALAALLLAAPLLSRAQNPPAEPMEISEVTRLGQRPKLIKSQAPQYPREMSRAGQDGVVNVGFIIDTAGNVQEARVIESTDKGFDAAALEAIRRWKFQPAEINGRRISTRTNQKIEFHVAAVGENKPPAWPEAPPPTGPAAEMTGEVLSGADLQKSGKKPKAIKQGPPVYPYAMSRAGLIGAVNIAFIIDKEGRVRNPYVTESNNPWFERAAIDAIMGWRYAPGEVDGHPVNVRAMQRIEFNLTMNGRDGQTPELWQVTKGKDHATLPAEFQWDTPPEPKNTLFPVYPFEQLKAGVQGKAKVSYVVGLNGRVLVAKLQEADTPEFGQAVQAMIDAWRFKPAKKKDGSPAYAKLGIEYDFRPNGRGDVPVNDQARDILRLLEKKPAKIAALQNLDQPPKPLSRRPPVYPSALREKGETGQAIIEFFIDENGDAQLPCIVSSTATEFGYAAAQAVATWRFEPPKRGGKTVVTRVRIPVEFSLRDPKPAANK